MTAQIVYRVDRLPHPFDPKQRRNGVYAYCLIKVVQPDVGNATEEPVAIFNFDSEAELFLAHVSTSEVEGKLVEMTRDQRELYESFARSKARRRT